MASPAKKKPRQDVDELLAFSRGAHVSKSALEQVFDRARAQGLPTASSRRTQTRARNTKCEYKTPHGAGIVPLVLPCKSGAVTIAIEDPFATLWLLARESRRFRNLLRGRLQSHHCDTLNPWSIVLYFDAVSPTDPLRKGTDLRDTQCVY